MKSNTFTSLVYDKPHYSTLPYVILLRTFDVISSSTWLFALSWWAGMRSPLITPDNQVQLAVILLAGISFFAGYLWWGTQKSFFNTLNFFYLPKRSPWPENHRMISVSLMVFLCGAWYAQGSFGQAWYQGFGLMLVLLSMGHLTHYLHTEWRLHKKLNSI
jgi:hypothetical protein